MSIAKRRKAFSEAEQIPWFKWEFLRRNADYQKDYAVFEARFGPWFRENGYWWSRNGPTYSRQAWYFFSSQIAPAAKEICKRWGVSDPYDPAWEFDKSGVRSEQGSCVSMPFFMSSDEDPGWSFEEPDPDLFPTEEALIHELLKGIPDTVERKPTWRGMNDRRFIRVEVDITAPNETSIAELERQIDFARRKYEAQVGPLPDHRRKPRLRLDQYESYLKVWQLRKDGKTFEQIAREVFPREMENANRFSPGVKKARSHFRRACELISGGYRQIDA